MGAGTRRVAINDDDAGFSMGVEVGPADVGGTDIEDQEEWDEWLLEREVNELLGRGWSVPTIARHLGISEALVQGLDACNPEDDFAYTPEEAYGVEPDSE